MTGTLTRNETDRWTTGASSKKVSWTVTWTDANGVTRSETASSKKMAIRNARLAGVTI